MAQVNLFLTIAWLRELIYIVVVDILLLFGKPTIAEEAGRVETPLKRDKTTIGTKEVK